MKLSDANKKLIGFAAIPVLMACVYFGVLRQSDNLTSHTNGVAVPGSSNGSHASNSSESQHAAKEMGTITDSGWGSSPFSTVPTHPESGTKIAQHAGSQLIPENKDIPSPEEVARNKKMEALGYMLPVEYYHKDFATLKALAKSGDAWAMMHLGERYYFELNKQPDNPDFDAKADYPKLAREQFMDALVAGKVRPASIISELYLAEKNVVEAYAWDIIAERLGDSFSVEWFKRTKDYQSMSDSERQQANARAIQLSDQLNQRAKSINSAIRF